VFLKLTILPGDGIGPEVTEEAVRVLHAVAGTFGHELDLTRKNIGGAGLVASKEPLPADTLQACLGAGAVLLGAVGSPSFDHLPPHLRPESGLLRLRRELGAYANLRPARCFPGLEDCSPLRPEVAKGVDLLIVRELLGGLYFGEPRLIHGAAGDRAATARGTVSTAAGAMRRTGLRTSPMSSSSLVMFYLLHPVREHDEPAVDFVEFTPVELVAQLFTAQAERVTAGVLTQHQPGIGNPD
jgi:isocitrate/isopropylmalate dehydrogenase